VAALRAIQKSDCTPQVAECSANECLLRKEQALDAPASGYNLPFRTIQLFTLLNCGNIYFRSFNTH
jgi:hypothetical protein